MSSDPYQDDSRIVTPFSSMSPSGDVEADVVYANYGSPDDFKKLDQMKVDVHGKIVLMRYGQNFRGVKVYLAQEHGAAGVILYSDPSDDGWKKGDKYPDGPWRPDTAVQRGSVGFIFSIRATRQHPGSHRSLRSEWSSVFLRENLRSCRRFQPLRCHMRMPGRFWNIWAGQTLLATGKVRCHSLITWDRGR